MTATFIKVLIATAILSTNSHAFQLKQLVDTWKGTRQETNNGVGWRGKAKISGEKRADGGVLLVEKGFSPMVGDYIARHRFAKNGDYSGTFVTYGIIISSSRGTWKYKGGNIVISGSGSNLGGKGKFSGTMTLSKKGYLRYSGTSKGYKVVLTGNPA